jgi:hypothetical protein
MNALRRLRLPVALALALTLMACATASPPSESSVFDTLARASQVEQSSPASCNTRFEIKSCHTSTGLRGDQDCVCIPREALQDPRLGIF